MTTDNTAPRSGSAKAVEAKPEHHSTGELRAEAARARAELAGTLDAIEYKLNVPKQAKLAAADISNKIRVLRDENPVALAAGVGGLAVAVGGAVFLAVRLLARR